MVELTGVAVFLVSYVVYYFTAFPAVTGGDSGELLAEACLIGTPHPPGYPLFTMLTHLFMLLPTARIVLDDISSLSFRYDPLPSPAWKANHMCCLLGAWAAFSVWAATKEMLVTLNMKHTTVIASLGAFLYAFAPLTWEYSTTAEVFALNNALCAFIVYRMCSLVNLLRMWGSEEGSRRTATGTTDTASRTTDTGKLGDRGDRRHWSLVSQSAQGGLACGCALANQHTSILLVAMVVPIILGTSWSHSYGSGSRSVDASTTRSQVHSHQERPLHASRFFWVLISSAAGFVLGFSAYLYLPWAAHNAATPGSWGHLQTLEGLLRHVLRTEYGTFRLGILDGAETGLERIGIYLAHASRESYHLLFVVTALGWLVVLAPLLLLLRRTRNRNSNSSGGGTSRKANLKVSTSTSTLYKKSNKKKSKGKEGVGASSINTGVNTAGTNSGQSTESTTTGCGVADPSGTHATTTITTNNSNNNDNTGSSTSSEALRSLSSSSSSSSPVTLTLAAALLCIWLFYTLFWHMVLSNLPLSAPMPFAVHSRFWMQPNIILYILMGSAAGALWHTFSGNTFRSFWLLLLDTAKKSDGTAGGSNAESKSIHSGTAGGASNAWTNWALQFFLVSVTVSVVILQRLPEMNKSESGIVLQQYALSVFNSLPPRSLLLSHTDLDWNPLRYLQHCEGVRPDVTHLSLQMVAYPWFIQRQAPLYPHVKFPSMQFAGVSTDRQSEGNAQLILRILSANGVLKESYQAAPSTSLRATSDNGSDDATGVEDNDAPLRALQSVVNTHFPGGFYLDMQSVNEAEIEALGQWRQGAMLIPWGTVYRVFGPLTLSQVQELHHHSLYHLRQLQKSFPSVNASFVHQFHAGSWERAAANVFYDAHYQLGLNLLTYCIELQANIEVKLLPLLLDRLHLASVLLLKTKLAVDKYNTFSGSVADLSKNCALAWMRMAALMDIVKQFRESIHSQIDAMMHIDDSKEIAGAAVGTSTMDASSSSSSRSSSSIDTSKHHCVFLNPSALGYLLSDQAGEDIKTNAKEVIGRFLNDYPRDKDYRAFSAVFAKLD